MTDGPSGVFNGQGWTGGSDHLVAIVKFALERLALTLEVRNPTRLLLFLLSGCPVKIELRSGCVIKSNGIGRRAVLEIVGLSALGAPCSIGSRQTAIDWLINLDDLTIETPSGIKFDLRTIDRTILAETFLYDIHYAGCNLEGSLVIDIGSNIGDTCLYFAEKGARVMAFEPDPSNFRNLKRNLQLNPHLSSRIVAREQAVGTDGRVQFKGGLRGHSGLNAYRGHSIMVESVSLQTIISEIDMSRVFLLKADCKGCEFGLVRSEALDRVDNLQIEYDAKLGLGSLDDVLNALRARGFRHLRVFKHNYGPYYLSSHGIISASRS